MLPSEYNYKILEVPYQDVFETIHNNTMINAMINMINAMINMINAMINMINAMTEIVKKTFST